MDNFYNKERRSHAHKSLPQTGDSTNKNYEPGHLVRVVPAIIMRREEEKLVPTEIAVALIGVGGSAIGSFIGILVNSKLTAYRIEQLEKKVDKHNTVIERTFKLEEAQAVMQEQIKVANHRIEDLEKEN